MIKSAHRFRGHNSLNYLYRHGAQFRARGLSLRVVDAKQSGSYRAAVIVSKKVHKSAVVRNRIRRRVFEIIRQNVDPAANKDFAITVFDESIATVGASELLKAVRGLFDKAGISVLNP